MVFFILQSVPGNQPEARFSWTYISAWLLPYPNLLPPLPSRFLLETLHQWITCTTTSIVGCASGKSDLRYSSKCLGQTVLFSSWMLWCIRTKMLTYLSFYIWYLIKCLADSKQVNTQKNCKFEFICEYIYLIPYSHLATDSILKANFLEKLCSPLLPPHTHPFRNG